jgi:hypothetical protein
MPPNVSVDQKGAYEEKPLVPPEAQEIGLGKTITLQLDLVEKFTTAMGDPAYRCQFTVQVRDSGGSGLGGCRVVIDDADLPAGALRGTTDGTGKLTDFFEAAPSKITFTVKDPVGKLLVSGNGRLSYDIIGKRLPNLNKIQLKAEVTLTTSDVQRPNPNDTFVLGTDAAPFKGVDASISQQGTRTSGVTDDMGIFTADSNSGAAATVRITYTDSKGKPQSPKDDVL